MDPGLIFIFVILGILFIILVVLLLYNNVKNVIVGNNSGIVTSTTHCTPSASTLPDLSFSLCCVVFGNLSSNKYLSNLNLVASFTPTPYIDVCAGFCTQGFDSTNQKCLGNITSDDTQFANCVNATKTNNCDDSSNPIATSNGIYMYASSAGTVLCPTTSICAVQL
jgi:hypothetical protein